MQRPKIKIQLHRTVIVLACLALMVLLMQGASWFSSSRQKVETSQAAELSQGLANQVAYSLLPYFTQTEIDLPVVTGILDHLAQQPRVIDVSLYDVDGSRLAHSGQSMSVRDRLGLTSDRAGSYSTRQIVVPLQTRNGPQGYLRLTLDTHTLASEARHVDNTTNLLRLMLLLSLAIGIILARTLLRDQRTHWQQSPYLLTAHRPITPKRDEEKNGQ
ncbi:YtjB family periplasmic protein [Rosenbergiella nectarea]|uniref:YtjB family periplasmic protein n=1 Tax=Rosenbergiella nectarea TaxID=988801 RepID=UPI001BDB60DD|nr:YtjB family periplasmic protein [Rosenbergiella nectarea]MBT0728905.1 YtjB family periplasmic protein [Rosenbergiella nectarea subsp. apis]